MDTTTEPHEFIEWPSTAIASDAERDCCFACGRYRGHPIHQVSASIRRRCSVCGEDIATCVCGAPDRANGAATNAAEDWRIERARRQQSSAATTSEAAEPQCECDLRFSGHQCQVERMLDEAISTETLPPELKPCPFCGAGTSGMVGELHKFIHANWCPLPATTTNISHVHKDGVNAWNTRVHDQRVAELELILRRARAEHSCDWNGCWCQDADAALSAAKGNNQ